jgi:subtilisin family serine protease
LFPGTRGNDVQIIDVEKGWNLTHEDMPGIFFQARLNTTGDDRQHGTSVLGVLAAGENGFGVTGIVPQSRIRRVGRTGSLLLPEFLLGNFRFSRCS